MISRPRAGYWPTPRRRRSSAWWRPDAEIIEIAAAQGRADGAPVSYALHRFPAERFAALPAAFAESGSITAALAACGVADYTRRTTALVARMPSEIEARYLEQPLTRPVLQSDAVNIDPDGIPIQRSITVFSGDRVQILVTHTTCLSVWTISTRSF